LQLSYQAFGQNIPRNTKDQIKLKKPQIPDTEKLSRGYVIFWKGHVGIMVDQSNCLHSNAHHMCTVVEPLKKIISRGEDNNPIIKIMNFND